MNQRAAQRHVLHHLMTSDDPVSLVDVFIDLCYRAGPAITRRGVFFAVMNEGRAGSEGQFVHLNDDLDVTIAECPQDEESFKRALIRGWDAIEGRWA